MKYLWKKLYPDFIVGKYYYSDNNIHYDSIAYKYSNYDYQYILINDHHFILNGDYEVFIMFSKLDEYFINIQELRKMKLKKLYEISM